MTDEPRRPRISDTLGQTSTAWVRPEDVPSYTLDQIRTDLKAALAERGDSPAIHDFQRACVARLPWHKSNPTAWHDLQFPGIYAFLRERVLGSQLAYVSLPLSTAIERLDALIAEVMRHEDAS